MIASIVARYLKRADFFSDQMDTLVRVQILEGATRVHFGTWSKNRRPSVGLDKAKGEIPNLHPDWLVTSEIYKACKLTLRRALHGIPHIDADDLLQRALAGIGQSDEPVNVPWFWGVGQMRAAEILRGAPPSKILSTAVSVMTNKARQVIAEYRTRQLQEEKESILVSPADELKTTNKQHGLSEFYEQVETSPLKAMAELVTSPGSTGSQFRSILHRIARSSLSQAEFVFFQKLFSHTMSGGDLASPTSPSSKRPLVNSKVLGDLGMDPSPANQMLMSRVLSKIGDAVKREFSKPSSALREMVEELGARIDVSRGIMVAASRLSATLVTFGKVASPHGSMVSRIAYRHIRAQLNTLMDSLARLQVLEGALNLPHGKLSNQALSGNAPSDEPGNPRGPASNKPLRFGRGFALARAIADKQGYDIDSSWFEPSRLYLDALGAMRRHLTHDTRTTPEDLLQNSMCGIGTKWEAVDESGAEQLKEIKCLFYDVGEKLRQRILVGQETPESARSKVITFATFRARSHNKAQSWKDRVLGDIKQDRPETIPSGAGAYLGLDERNQYDLISEALLGRDTLAIGIRKFFGQQFGRLRDKDSMYAVKWLDLVETNGKLPKNRDILTAMGLEINTANEMAVGRALTKAFKVVKSAIENSPEMLNTMGLLAQRHSFGYAV